MADNRIDFDKELQIKVIHAGDDWVGQPYLVVDDSSVRIAGALDRGVSVSAAFGTLIQGPCQFSESPENISFGGGYWRLNPMLTACIGSSSAIPVPTLVYDQPDALKAGEELGAILSDLNSGAV